MESGGKKKIIAQNLGPDAPFFSICIPQHNRTLFLLEALKIYKIQTFKSFEICISDDASTDGLQGLITDFMKNSGLNFLFVQQAENLRYDANLREVISLASGEFCLLMGNDDSLSHENALQEFYDSIGPDRSGIGAAICNVMDVKSGAVKRRARRSMIFPGGAETALRYSDVSFMSGVLLSTKLAQKFSSNRWDGSEYYQLFLYSKIIASGKQLLHVDRPLVSLGIQIPDHSVESYKTKPLVIHGTIKPRSINVNYFPGIISSALEEYYPPEQVRRYAFKVALRIYLVTYPYWIMEYKRVQSIRFSLGVIMGMAPFRLPGVQWAFSQAMILSGLYFTVSLASLVTPVSCFYRFKEKLHGWIKERF